MLGLMASDYLEREIFCCGPEPFMAAVREMLVSMGFDMDHYHQESFGAPVATEAEAPVIDDVAPDEDARAQITFTESGITTACAETDTVLAVAKRSGLNIPSGCTFVFEQFAYNVSKPAATATALDTAGFTEEHVRARPAPCAPPARTVTRG